MGLIRVKTNELVMEKLCVFKLENEAQPHQPENLLFIQCHLFQSSEAVLNAGLHGLFLAWIVLDPTSCKMAASVHSLGGGVGWKDP